MIRTPLRPLARILPARARGENPDVIERENIRLRHETMRERARERAQGRLVLLALGFCAGFAAVGARMAVLAASEPTEPRSAPATAQIQAQRADIVDRNGRVLATNLATHALYAHPQDMVDPVRAARELARIFPDLDAEKLQAQFTGESKFVWVRRKISPEQRQEVHEIGEPGLLFGTREMRLYPNGRLAAHVLGGAGFGQEGVHSAEVIGTAGLEKALDGRLRGLEDPAELGRPLTLSLDLTVQAVVMEVLGAGMKLLNAKGAAAIIMDARTGEIVSMVSLPDFDPNDRPRPPTSGEPSDSPLFNRAVQGVYELGSVMKIFPVAQALELGLVNPDTKVNTKGPMTLGRFKVRDFRNYGPELSVTQVIVKSSNIGTARIMSEIGPVRQQAFLSTLGFLEPIPLEMVEASGGKPLLPRKWGDIASATISYGHGLSATPLHAAVGYAAMVNGGYLVRPTLLKGDAPAQGPRVISQKTSDQIRVMLRQVVTEGTARMADVPGYMVGGKTGTADKLKPNGGGYYKDKVMANFAGAFPMNDPAYVIVVSLDEPVETSGSEPRRTAGWTAVPVTSEIIRRVAPLLGLRPVIEPAPSVALTRARN
ncbi:peptidoglycan D,D-transpeptidase FtsI family protein [Ruixingdingia sedimenti]|uniref:Penicillin-binding protein 2 n=1 Tax=Ruixingdingia sedimenti TaxID=3073604 RepID=A0ABU1FCD5_9RHOB|nr:penicillin-binding protein 2 [Xinfangfangia sp. LG-4]MDR5654114.1 penicillin-binding protein 2 [Xinfangfangia sp. LG-4]